jgi:sugar lactone lactonase YvrE
MKTPGLRRCALLAGCVVFGLVACRSGAITPPAPTGPFQSGAAPESVPVRPSWTKTKIASGFGGPLAVDASNNVYVAIGGAIKKIAPDGKITDVGHGFANPEGVAVHNGYVYVADTSHNAIKKVAKNGTISVVVRLKVPWSIAVGKGGSIYVLQAVCGCIKKVTPNGKITTVFTLSGGNDITLDSATNLYVAAYSFGVFGCCATGKIYKITPRGKVNARSFKHMATESVAVDASGNVYAGIVRSGVQDAAVYRIAPNGRETKIAFLCSACGPIASGLAFRYGAIYAGLFAKNEPANSAVYKISP